MAMIHRTTCSLSSTAWVRMAFAAATWLWPSADALAQSNPQTRFTMQSPFEQKGPAIVKDALGRPCLDIEAAAKPQRINDKILDHVVSVLNRCPRNIKVKVCYVGVQDCKEFVLQGYKREDTVLGSMTGVSYFKYVVTQQ